LRMDRAARERHRSRPERHRQVACSLGTRSGRLPEGPLPSASPPQRRWSMEARDERRLLRLQKQMAGHKLLIIDELGFVPLSKTGAELLFELISQRYERGSSLITSNLPFDEWTETTQWSQRALPPSPPIPMPGDPRSCRACRPAASPDSWVPGRKASTPCRDLRRTTMKSCRVLSSLLPIFGPPCAAAQNARPTTAPSPGSVPGPVTAVRAQVQKNERGLHPEM
jgi:IstB-like ATP binding protein